MDTTQTKEYIIKNLNLGKLLPNEQDSVIQKLESNIEKKVFIVILDTLNEKEQKELLAVSENGTTAIVHSWIEKKIPNIKEIIEKVAKEIVEDFKKRSSNA